MQKNNSFWREVDEAKADEEAVVLSVLEYGGESQQIPKFTSSLKNVKNFSLDRIDSKLFLPRTNGQH